jgi:hypothetical protein
LLEYDLYVGRQFKTLLGKIKILISSRRILIFHPTYTSSSEISMVAVARQIICFSHRRALAFFLDRWDAAAVSFQPR